MSVGERYHRTAGQGLGSISLLVAVVASSCASCPGGSDEVAAPTAPAASGATPGGSTPSDGTAVVAEADGGVSAPSAGSRPVALPLPPESLPPADVLALGSWVSTPDLSAAARLVERDPAEAARRFEGAADDASLPREAQRALRLWALEARIAAQRALAGQATSSGQAAPAASAPHASHDGGGRVAEVVLSLTEEQLTLAAEDPLLAADIRLEVARKRRDAGLLQPALAALSPLLDGASGSASSAAAPPQVERAAVLATELHLAAGQVDAAREVLRALPPGSDTIPGLSLRLALHSDTPPPPQDIARHLRQFPAAEDAATLLAAIPARGLDEADRVSLAEALWDAGRPQTAKLALAGLGAVGPWKTPLRCRAGLLQGLALDRVTARKNLAGQEAVHAHFAALAASCNGDVAARATFIAGRNRARAVHREKGPRKKAAATEAARALLGRHIEAWPERSTVDDAAVLLVELEPDVARADALRKRVLAAHPGGDMAEGLAWGLVWPAIEAGAWAEARQRLEALPGVSGAEPLEERHGGRFRYWLARAQAETGDVVTARAAFTRILSDHPLSWYAVLALSRLCRDDLSCARRTLAEAASGPAASPAPDAAPGVVAGADTTSGQPTQVDATTGNEPLPSSDVVSEKEAWSRLWASEPFRRAVAWARVASCAHTPGSPFHAQVLAALDDVPVALRRPSGLWLWARTGVLQLAGAWSGAMGELRAAEGARRWPHPSPAPAGPPEGHEAPLSALSAGPWLRAYPRAFEDLVQLHAGREGLPSAWVWAIARTESNFNPQVVSWANAIGLMQIIPTTAAHLARGTDIDPAPEQLKRPEIALALGTRYLARLLGRHRHIPLASAGYNAGGGAVGRWRKTFGGLELDRFVEAIPYPEAHHYAKSVTQSMARYLWLHEGVPLLVDLSGPVGLPSADTPLEPEAAPAVDAPHAEGESASAPSSGAAPSSGSLPGLASPGASARP
jgi:soluble lytic murein transglycosylase-like protein